MTELQEDHLYLVADDQGVVHLYRVGDGGRLARTVPGPRHGRGSLGHGYTSACNSAGEQCNNAQCRAGRSHDRCIAACSGETYWDDLGPWQVTAGMRASLRESLSIATRQREVTQ